jgi:hypothetical protein
MATFIHDNVTSTKPKLNPKTLKFVQEDTNFGNTIFCCQKIVITLEFMYQST